MTEELRTKGEVWREAHAQRTECPSCGKFVTLRTLRWKHVCRDRPSQRRRLLDSCAASLRLEGLLNLAVESFENRMREGRENGGATSRKRRADQIAVGGT